MPRSKKPKFASRDRFVTVPGFVVSFKKRRSGRLLNVAVPGAKDPCAAARAAAARLQELGENVGPKGWREYGVSTLRQYQVGVTIHKVGKVFEEWRIGDYLGPVAEQCELTGEALEAHKTKERAWLIEGGWLKE